MASTIDFNFRNVLLKMHGALSLSYCYQCGTCSGGCPVAKETNGKYNPRRIIEKSLLGMKDKLIKDPVDTSSGKVALTNGPTGYHCFATSDEKGHASAGTCYKGTLAFPKSVFAWFNS